jgi:hypothetical protein
MTVSAASETFELRSDLASRTTSHAFDYVFDER